MFRKQIMYNRDTRDFAMYLNGRLIGYAPSYIDADTALDQLMMELLRAGSGTRVA